MNYLLDTHYILWLLFQPHNISKGIGKILESRNNNIIISAVSLWEISIKFQSGKLQLENLHPSQLHEVLKEGGFNVESLKITDASSISNLTATYHKDPFDRMLIWISINNNYTLISDDKLIMQYKTEGLKLLW